jgi:acrylyl-CoA reductase (NADPH)
MRAVLAAEPEKAPGRLGEIDTAELPAGDLVVAVRYSSLNYKDGLAVTGKGPIARIFPLVCGVDLAGVVESSGTEAFSPGDEVIVTGFGLGEDRHGGYGELARVESSWAVRLPDSMDLRTSMAIGTAGLTAMLSVLALERHGLAPGGKLPVAVTGAAGGVGSIAVALLARAGYEVVAVSGRPSEEDYLRGLGASQVVRRSELEDAPRRPLSSRRYAGAIDVAGGPVLATLLRETDYGGCVAACGLVGSAELSTTVHPFILRAVDLAGVESVYCPTAIRQVAWDRLASDLPRSLVDELSFDASLEEVPELAARIVEGQVRGRAVIEVGA